METENWEKIGTIKERGRIIHVFQNAVGDIRVRVQEEGGKLKSPSEEIKGKIADLVFPVVKGKKKFPLIDP